jgi:hypothetical protein
MHCLEGLAAILDGYGHLPDRTRSTTPDRLG